MLHRRAVLDCVLLAIVGIVIQPTASGQTHLTTVRVASGLSRPVFLTHAPGDFDRVFIVEQHTGRIKIMNLATGSINPTPFLDIDVATGGEQGLLGLAFHPEYANNGYFYVNVSASGSGATNIRRYAVSANPDIADPSSATTILTIPQPFENHNGGWIAFGPNDGYLYIANGDGGGLMTPDPENRAQTITDEWLGKMLRLDIDDDDFPGDPNRNYAVPPRQSLCRHHRR